MHLLQPLTAAAAAAAVGTVVFAGMLFTVIASRFAVFFELSQYSLSCGRVSNSLSVATLMQFLRSCSYRSFEVGLVNWMNEATPATYAALSPLFGGAADSTLVRNESALAFGGEPTGVLLNGYVLPHLLSEHVHYKDNLYISHPLELSATSLG